MSKPKLINVLPHRTICEIKKYWGKKCSFAFCVCKIDEESMCDFYHFACFLKYIFGIVIMQKTMFLR